MTAHTPGPWRVEVCHRGWPLGIDAPNDKDIRGAVGHIVRRNGIGLPSSPVAHANARLIAAAPDMLEALRNVGLVLSEKFKSGRVRAADEELWAAYSHIISAVVKATGGTLTAPQPAQGGEPHEG